MLGLMLIVFVFVPFDRLRWTLFCGCAVALLGWGATYTTRHHEWLLFILLLIEVLTSATYLPDEWNSAMRYTLEAIFCLPILPAFYRSGLWREGGFRLLLFYLGWAAITVSYSLSPVYSSGRLLDTSLLFAAIWLCAAEADNPADLNRLLRCGLYACMIIVALLGISALAAPADVIWQPGDLVTSAGRVIYTRADAQRFQGFLNGPNQVGETMLTTIALGLLCWPAASRRFRVMIAATLGMAGVFLIYTDSRTSAAALLIGAVACGGWRYRLRGGLLISIAAAGLLVVAITLGNDGLRGYIYRGDTASFTGRSDIWAYTFDQIKQRPLLGYGYQVEGALLDSKYFPLWFGPWTDGPHSSLHENYLSRAAGVGVPAALFWLFIILRPWVSLFRGAEDRPDLKRIACFAALPVLILNFAESSAADCRYSVGILLMLAWALAERHRVATLDRDRPPPANIIRFSHG